MGFLFRLGGKKYGMIAAGMAALTLLAYGLILKSANARLRVENAQLETNLAVQGRQIAQIQEAEAVANAWADRFEAEAQDYDKIIQKLQEGETDEILDQIIPDGLTGRLRGDD